MEPLCPTIRKGLPAGIGIKPAAKWSNPFFCCLIEVRGWGGGNLQPFLSLQDMKPCDLATPVTVTVHDSVKCQHSCSKRPVRTGDVGASHGWAPELAPSAGTVPSIYVNSELCTVLSQAINLPRSSPRKHADFSSVSWSWKQREIKLTC